MEYIPAAGIVTPVADTDEFYPGNYRMNIYRGCSHGCIYCDSRADCYRVEDFDTVKAKENALKIIERELSSKRKSGIVTTGAMTDPYNPQEKHACLTIGALELINRYGFGAGITTKSGLVARDAEILSAITLHSPAYVTFSITCADDTLSKIIEPYAPVTSERLAALQKLTESGVMCGVWLNPVLPYITDNKDNMISIARQSAAYGAKYLVCFYGMTLRDGNREYFLRQLDKRFAGHGLREWYSREFGNSYVIASPDASHLHDLLMEECRKLHLLTDFREVRKAIANTVRQEQMKLF